MTQTPSNAGRQLKCSFILSLIILIFAGSAPYAAAEEKPLEKSGWQFHVAPYMWFLSMEGDVTVNGQKSSVDTSFSEIWDELNIAGMVNFEASNEKWGFFGDVIAANLGNQASVNGIKIDPRVNLLMLTAGGFYRLGTWMPSDDGGKDRPAVSLDGLLGARYTYLSTRLDIKDFRNVSADEGWLDPLIGARAILDLSERWELALQGTVGGFGVGSDFTWGAYGDIGYRFSLFSMENNGRFVVGYRALHQNYSNGSGDNKFKWNVTMYGPVLGLVIEF